MRVGAEMFAILMGGNLSDREGSSGFQDQHEGYLTTVRRAGWSVGRESWDFGCLLEGSGCCESIVVVSRPVALRAGRGLPTGMPSYKSVAH